MTDPGQGTDALPFQPVPPEPSPALEPTSVAGPGIGPGTGRPRATTWVNVALGVALAVAIGGIGFAAGRMTAPATANAAANGRLGNGRFPGGGHFPVGGIGDDDGRFRGLFGIVGASVQGTVDAISGDALTLRLADGQTVQVSLDGTTTYHSQTSATAGDVRTGGTVIVRLNLDRGDGAEGGTTTGPSASDVTIVP